MPNTPQRSRWTLPVEIHPPKSRRFVVCVPDEPHYIAAFEGLLIELTYSKNWQRDSAQTAAIVSRIWQDVLADAKCEQECTTVIQEMDIDMSVCEQLRFHDGRLQGLCCGEWSDISGQDFRELGSPDQQGEGAPQPEPGGGCQTYHATFAATSKYLIPTLVNAGDTITFSNAKGQGNDGTLSPWHCPDGSTFIAGLCITGTGGTSGGDPAPAINHMRLVVKIGATYYQADSGSITVPGGITGEQAVLQCNDSVLSDNSGSYSVDVEVCNNAAVRYSHTFNFALGPQGWAGSGPTVSDGWVGGKFIGHLGGFAYENRIYITVPGTRTADHVQVKMNIDKTEAGAIYMEGYAGPGPTGANTTLYTQGSPGLSTANQNRTLDFDITMVGGHQVLQIDAVGNTASAYNELLAVTLSGPGADPF